MARVDSHDDITIWRNRIRALTGIALQSGSVLSLDELCLLLRTDWFPSTQVLKQFLVSDEDLQREVTVLGEVVTPKGHEHLATARSLQTDRTIRSLQEARVVIGTIARLCPWTRLVGISGSTAYNGSKPGDDIDVFIVVKSRRVWITLLVALLTARVGRIRGQAESPFCFNTVWEDSECDAAFRTTQEPLFAREALSMKVFRGQVYYLHLLESAPWMALYFPQLYTSRLETARSARPEPVKEGRAHWSLMNLLAFSLLAPYLLLTNLLRNRALEKRGRADATFDTIVDISTFSLESHRFEKLRRQYGEAF